VIGLLLFIGNAADAVTTVTIQYALPDFGMKLIVLDSAEINVDEFEERLETVTMEYLNEYLREALPDQSPPLSVSRETFRSASVSGNLEKFSMDTEETEGIPLAVLRAGLEGVGRFEYDEKMVADKEIANQIQPNSHLHKYLQDAFAQDRGFWDFVAKIEQDDILGLTGKLQIAVGTLVVGEGSLVGDQNYNNEADEEEVEQPSEGLSKGGIAGICIAVMIFAFGFVWALLLLRQYRKERAFERRKLQRRQEAKQQREKLIEDMNKKEISSSHSVTSMSSGSEDLSQQSYKVKQFSTMPNRSYANRPPPKGRVRTRPSVQARKSSESLLHMIIEEADENHDETSHRHTSHEETDDVENVFSLTQSSERFGRKDARTMNVKVQANNDSSWRESFSSLGDSANSLFSLNDSTKMPPLIFGQGKRRDSFSVNSLAGEPESDPAAKAKSVINEKDDVQPVNEGKVQNYFGGSYGNLNKSIVDGFGSFNSSISGDSIDQTGTQFLHNSTTCITNNSHGTGSISRQSLCKIMNQDDLDILNPDECDLEGSDLSMGFADEELSGSFNLADSTNFLGSTDLRQFSDADFASPEDYELKMNRSAELS
jgi:hypothetical protein